MFLATSPLEVQRELIGVLVLQVVGDVERPRGIVGVGLHADRRQSVDPAAPRSRVSSVSISPSPLVSTELHGPTSKNLHGPLHERHVGAEPPQRLDADRLVVAAVRGPDAPSCRPPSACSSRPSRGPHVLKS